MAVQPHGGHFWSSMGQVQRPMDIVSLRIDNQVPPQHLLYSVCRGALQTKASCVLIRSNRYLWQLTAGLEV